MSTKNPGSILEQLVIEVKGLLQSITEENSRGRQAPDKWSKRQILGHLIDSAINNHRRFIIAQTTDNLNFEGYDQEFWVQAHGYHERSWSQLVEYWSVYNLNMASAIKAIRFRLLIN